LRARRALPLVNRNIRVQHSPVDTAQIKCGESRKEFAVRQLRILFAVIYIGAVAQAKTPVSGEVTGMWSASGSPYWVTGELTVPKGETLRIEEDVEILFTGPYALTVYGTLRVDGDGGDDEEVKFASAPDYKEGWGGIRLLNASSECKLRSLSIKGAFARGTDTRGQGGALFIENTVAEIINCAIGECEAESFGGALAILGGNVTLTNTAVGDCRSQVEYGIVYIRGAKVRFTNFALGDNRGIGALIAEKSDVSFVNTAISDQSGANGWGIVVRDSELTLTNVAISDNSAGGVKLTAASTARITTSALSGKNALENDDTSEVTLMLSAVDKD
jgi:hypothetical protein